LKKGTERVKSRLGERSALGKSKTPAHKNFGGASFNRAPGRKYHEQRGVGFTGKKDLKRPAAAIRTGWRHR